MKTKLGIILIAIILFAYFIFNTWLAVNWISSKIESKTTKQPMAKCIKHSRYYSERNNNTIYEVEEKGDTLKVLKEGEYVIKMYVGVKEDQ